MKKVAILIPHYNNPKGLLKSIRSVNEQILVDIVVVDDGSAIDFNVDEISQYKNGTIIPLYLEKNEGIEHALNYGLKYLVQHKYNYVARLDCGDLCCKGRIEKQVNVLKGDDDIKLVGSYAAFINLKGEEKFVYKVPTDFQNISKKMYLKVMFIHPSVMMNIDIIKKIGYYPIDYPAAEDYAYFFKIIKNFKASNIDEVLVYCEINPHGISSQKRKVQLFNKLRLIKKYFYFGIYPILGILYTIVQLILPQKLILILKKYIN